MPDRDDVGGLEARWNAATARLRSLLEPTVSLTGSLQRGVAAQTQRYRDEGAVSLATDADVDAYLAARMPATMAAAGAAMRALAAAMPRLAPGTMLDVGAGTGSATWAAVAVWPSLRAATALERSAAMAARGAALAAGSGLAPLQSARWLSGDARRAPMPAVDLVTATYVLGELPPAEREAMIARLWQATAPDGALLLVEPGSSAGYARILAARAQLIGAGGTVAAPCPHDNGCPMAAPDWCHFGVRLARSRLHRRAKGGSVPYEDEPYAYVAVTRGTVERAARVLARPDVRSGAIGLRLCTVAGLEERVLSRRDGPAYREARHAGWGSAVRP